MSASERSAPHVGLVLPNYGPALDAQRLVDATRAAERSGFDSAWVTDHILVPESQVPVYGTITEALVTLGYLLASTDRIRLGVSALIVPQREPVLTLKQLLSLDYLSGGRVLTAVAAGWMDAEFATLQASFQDRGRRLDEWLRFASEAAERAPGMVVPPSSPTEGGWLAPPPASPGGPELWIAGVSRATLRRAANTGVWHPVALSVAQLRPMAEEFRRRSPQGRIVLRIGVYLAGEPEADSTDERGRPALRGPADWLVERFRDYLDAGCDGFVVNLDHASPGVGERAVRFGDEVLRALTNS